MKYVIALALILGFSTAQAATNLGDTQIFWTTMFKLEEKAQDRMSERLGCLPNTGNCNAVLGREYEIHVDIRNGVGPAAAHAIVRATAFNDPDVGHFLIWASVYTIFDSCPLPGHWPKMQK